MLRLPSGVDEDQLCVAAAARGLAVQGTRAMYGALPGPDGLFISYARAPAGVLTQAVHRLAAAVASMGDGERTGSSTAPARGVRPATALDYF